MHPSPWKRITLYLEWKTLKYGKQLQVETEDSKAAGTGSNWNRDIPGMDRPHASTELLGMIPFATVN